MLIRLTYQNGEAKEIDFKDLRAFKRSKEIKDPFLKYAELIDAITKVVIALINLSGKSRKKVSRRRE